MKIMAKTILIILLISLTFFIVSPINNSYASGLSEIITGADQFIKNGVGETSPIKESDLKNISNPIYTVLLVLAIIIAVIVGLVIGIKFMTGSVAEKAKIKETLIPYIAGCIVIFGAFAIWRIVVNIMREIWTGFTKLDFKIIS